MLTVQLLLLLELPYLLLLLHLGNARSHSRIETARHPDHGRLPMHTHHSLLRYNLALGRGAPDMAHRGVEWHLLELICSHAVDHVGIGLHAGVHTCTWMSLLHEGRISLWQTLDARHLLHLELVA